jgi:hypothetical protein
MQILLVSSILSASEKEHSLQCHILDMLAQDAFDLSSPVAQYPV